MRSTYEAPDTLSLLTPITQFQSDVLLSVWNGVCCHGAEIDEILFGDCAAYLYGPGGVQRVAAGSTASLAPGGLDAALSKAVTAQTRWAELLYDLGANIDLLDYRGQTPSYLSVQRCAASTARVRVMCNSIYTFDLEMTREPVGLPETLADFIREQGHQWLHNITV